MPRLAPPPSSDLTFNRHDTPPLAAPQTSFDPTVFATPTAGEVGAFIALVQAFVDQQALPGLCATTVAVAAALAGRMDWGTGESRPGWPELISRTSKSRATVARHLSLLRRGGLVSWAAGDRPAAGQGCGRRLPGHVRKELGRRADATVYVCHIPPGSHTSQRRHARETPRSTPVLTLRENPRARARVASHTRSLRLPRQGTARRAGYDLGREVQRRGWLGPLRHVTPGWLTHLLTPLAAAGWTAGDVLEYLDSERYAADVRHPRHWLAHRLRGALAGPSPSQRRSRAHAAQLLEQDRYRARAAADARTAATPERAHEHVAQIKAMLAARRRTGALAGAQDGRAPRDAATAEEGRQPGGADGADSAGSAVQALSAPGDVYKKLELSKASGREVSERLGRVGL